MVYVVVDEANKERVFLVAGNDKEEIKDRIKLASTERLIGTFTNNEISVLSTSRFVVIAG